MIEVNVGGSPIESWIDQYTLEHDDKAVDLLTNWRKSDFTMPLVRERAVTNLKNAINLKKVIHMILVIIMKLELMIFPSSLSKALSGIKAKAIPIKSNYMNIFYPFWLKAGVRHGILIFLFTTYNYQEFALPPGLPLGMHRTDCKR